MTLWVLAPFSPEWNAGFTNGNFAVLACPAWMLGHIKNTAGADNMGKWDIAAIPGGGGNWGGSWLAVPTQSKYPAAAAKLAETVTRVQLTPRELAALRLLADGKANKEIANELDISERTVKTHLEHLFEKLGVTSRTEAVKVATRRGLVRLQ